MEAKLCHDCGAAPGALHADGCDVERCPDCGGQLLSCGCAPTRPRLPWTGKWPGEAECRELGWYARLVPGAGWVRCAADHPEAQPDLNRLFIDAQWDADAGRFARKEARDGP